MENESTDFILEDTEVLADSANSQTNKERQHKRGKRIKKCFKSVLKFLLVVILLFHVLLAVGAYCLYRWLSVEVGQLILELLLSDNINIEQFTTEMPLDVMEGFTSVMKKSNSFLTEEDFPTCDLDALKETAILFWDSIQSGISPPEDFVLTAADVNGFFASNTDYFQANTYFAEIKSNEYRMSFSLPTDFLPGGEGRFFNGYAIIQWDPETNRLSLKVDSSNDGLLEEPIMGQYVDVDFQLTSTSMDDGKTLNLQVLNGKVFDYEIPKEFIDEHYNLLEEFYDCDSHDDDDDHCKETRNFLKGLAGVSLEDGQVVVHGHPTNP